MKPHKRFYVLGMWLGIILLTSAFLFRGEARETVQMLAGLVSAVCGLIGFRKSKQASARS